MASAHSPWLRCQTLTLSMSLLTCTRSPTANGEVEEVDDVESELDAANSVESADCATLSVASATLTLVKTPGLKVHLQK